MRDRRVVRAGRVSVRHGAGLTKSDASRGRIANMAGGSGNVLEAAALLIYRFATTRKPMNRCTIAFLFLSLLMSAAAAPANADQSYICIPAESVGYAFNKAARTWYSTKFRASSAYKYIVSERGGRWGFRQFGDKMKIDLPCQLEAPGLVICSLVPVFQLTFSPSTLRFQEFFPAGYVAPPDGFEEGANTPSFAIGTCSPI